MGDTSQIHPRTHHHQYHNKVNQYDQPDQHSDYQELLAQENENILDNIKKTISEQRAVTESGVVNGVILESALLSMKSECIDKFV